MGDWDKKTDDDLIYQANMSASGQGAIVEAMRRLREALLGEHRAAAAHTRVLVNLTWVIAGLTLVVAVLTGVILYRGE